MKQIITILLFATLCINSKAQCNLPYRPLTEFGTDTTAFIIYNFMDRAECYKGKTLKEVSKDLQIPIKDFVIQRNFKNKNKIPGIHIYIYPSKKVNYLRETNQEINGIIITWEEEFNKNSEQFQKIYRKDEWDKETYNYFKGMKIKEIRAVIPMYSKYSEKYKPKETKSSTTLPKTMILYIDSIHR